MAITPTPKINILAASEIEPEDVQWLWHPYIPRGMMTFLEGDPGIGKSYISCAIAAAVSSGQKLPGMAYPLPPQNVLMINGEDSAKHTIVPRLIGLGANLANIFIVEEPFVFDAAAVRELEEMLVKFSLGIIFIDPIVAFMGGKRDINKANDMRELTKPLHRIADRSGCSIVMVRHLKKGDGGKDLYRGIGSIDLTGAVRSALLVEQNEEGDTAIWHIKSNVGPKGPGIGYRVNDGVFEWLPAPSRRKAEPAGSSSGPSTTTKVAAARAFLKHLLAHGPVPALEVEQRAMEENIAKRTLAEAKRGFAHSYREGHEWFWALIDAEPEEPEETAELAQLAPEPAPATPPLPFDPEALLARARALKAGT